MDPAFSFNLKGPAVAVLTLFSSRFLLQPLSDANFKTGFNRLYDWNLARSLRRIYAEHHPLFEEAAAKGDKRKK